MLPTVADLLSLDVIRRGSPQVVAGSGGLGARVRWVHVLELADAAHLLQGGELVLTTGVALPAEPALLARYAADLASAGGAGVSALAVELGRRYVGALPRVLVRAAADSGLTLIAFEREVSFVEITEAVHARIIDVQLDELRASERLHEVFTELSVSGASADEVVRQAAILAGRPVILADLSHRVLACEPEMRLRNGMAKTFRGELNTGCTIRSPVTVLGCGLYAMVNPQKCPSHLAVKQFQCLQFRKTRKPRQKPARFAKACCAERHLSQRQPAPQHAKRFVVAWPLDESARVRESWREPGKCCELFSSAFS
jgi:hypothetical protein